MILTNAILCLSITEAVKSMPPAKAGGKKRRSRPERIHFVQHKLREGSRKKAESKNIDKSKVLNMLFETCNSFLPLSRAGPYTSHLTKIWDLILEIEDL